MILYDCSSSCPAGLSLSPVFWGGLGKMAYSRQFWRRVSIDQMFVWEISWNTWMQSSLTTQICFLIWLSTTGAPGSLLQLWPSRDVLRIWSRETQLVATWKSCVPFFSAPMISYASAKLCMQGSDAGWWETWRMEGLGFCSVCFFWVTFALLASNTAEGHRYWMNSWRSSYCSSSSLACQQSPP